MFLWGGEVAWVKRSVLWSVAMHLMLVTLWVPRSTQALIAKQNYYMDQSMDCRVAGYQSIPRDQVAYVYGRSDGNTGTEINCYIQFEPETSGDTLRVTMQPGSYINSPNVEIYVEVKGAGSYTYTAMSGSQPGPLEAIDGKAILRIRKRYIHDFDFHFVLTVTAKESDVKYRIRTVDYRPTSISTSTPSYHTTITIVVIVIVVVIKVTCCGAMMWLRNKRSQRAK